MNAKLDAIIAKVFETTPIIQGLPEAFKSSKSRFIFSNFQLNIGHPRAGASVHYHHPTTSALLYGLKHWFMYPPNDAFYNTESIHQWYHGSYKRLKEKGIRPLECMQQSGDVIFIPDAWAHGILYLRESISVSHLYTPPRA